MIAPRERFWSTSTVKPDQRFDFWHDAVSNAVLNVDVETRQRSQFEGWISAQPRGRACFSIFSSAPHRILRTARHLSRALDESYLVSFQIAGTARLEQSERRLELMPGDIGIVNGAVPFRVEFPDKVRRVVAVLPRRLLPVQRKDLSSQLPKLAADHPLSALVRAYMLRLADAKGQMSQAQEQVLLSNLCALLSVSGSDTRRGLIPEALIGWLRTRLADRNLSPGEAADVFGVSVRTIHGLMAKAGISFTAFLLQERVQACGEVLRTSPRRSVSEIALSHGFGSAAHFHRAFKARFGMTPKDWQALHAVHND